MCDCDELAKMRCRMPKRRREPLSTKMECRFASAPQLNVPSTSYLRDGSCLAGWLAGWLDGWLGLHSHHCQSDEKDCRSVVPSVLRYRDACFLTFTATNVSNVLVVVSSLTGCCYLGFCLFLLPVLFKRFNGEWCANECERKRKWNKMSEWMNEMKWNRRVVCWRGGNNHSVNERRRLWHVRRNATTTAIAIMPNECRYFN